MIFQGDCRKRLAILPEDCLDAVVTDPPYGLTAEPDMSEVLRHWLAGGDFESDGGGFMGKEWDSFVPGPATWRAIHRVMKPGAHLLSFFGARTYDLGVTALRLAGFEVRDQLLWMYGQGFPKSTSLDLEVAKARGEIGHRGAAFSTAGEAHERDHQGEARAHPGFGGPGTALKPAQEPIVLCRKPLAAIPPAVLAGVVGPLWWTHRQVTTAKQRAKESDRLGVWLPAGRLQIATARPLHPDGRGIIRVTDEAGAVVCTLTGSDYSDKPIRTLAANHLVYGTGGLDIDGCRIGEGGGRWPANVVMDDDCYEPRAADKDGNRYFYCPKTSKAEREAGLDDLETANMTGRDPTSAGVDNPRAGPGRKSGRRNHHPTVKPIELMRWLVRLVTPVGGTVLDPFCGSGSTGIAAVLEGRTFMGIDQDEGYCDIARRRIKHWAP